MPLINTNVILEHQENYSFMTDENGYIYLFETMASVLNNDTITFTANVSDSNLFASIPYNSSTESVLLGKVVDSIQTRSIPDWATISTKSLGSRDVLINKMPTISGLDTNLRLL